MPIPSSETVRRADIFFAGKDQALKRDVRRLGEMVGELVKEQGGEALFDLVEAARRASIAHREGNIGALEELQTLLSALAPNIARDFIRAFSTYFQMVNMAEKVHRIRRRRAYLIDVKTPQPLGFIDTLNKLKDAGVGASEVEEAFGKVSVEPVFTAHPTEASRRTLLRKQQNIARHLVEMLDPYLTPQEERATLGRIRPGDDLWVADRRTPSSTYARCRRSRTRVVFLDRRFIPDNPLILRGSRGGDWYGFPQ